jgi:hypothetical protein
LAEVKNYRTSKFGSSKTLLAGYLHGKASKGLLHNKLIVNADHRPYRFSPRTKALNLIFLTTEFDPTPRAIGQCGQPPFFKSWLSFFLVLNQHHSVAL